MPWILLIEDEARLAASLRRGLEEEGFTVDYAADAREGEAKALAGGYDAFVVDRRLPHGDGVAVVKALREAGRSEPVLMLTALGEVEQRVEGLEAGADDYLPKPFAFEELIARLRALLRRPPLQQQRALLQLGALALDASTHRVTLGGSGRPGGGSSGDPSSEPSKSVLLNLRPKEYALLEYLLRSPGTVRSREVIGEYVWGDSLYVTDNALDVTVSGLRQKLAEASREAGVPAPEIETVRGVGYRLMPNPGGLHRPTAS